MSAQARPGYHTVTPRLFVSDPGALLAFLGEVFGATGEAVGGAPAEVRIGDSLLLVSGSEYREAMRTCLYVYVEDADATYARAMAAGAASLEEPRETPYGDRRAMVQDAWGNAWQVASRL
jgi:uncharacterized glyoxalase superfamily protein PhnB